MSTAKNKQVVNDLIERVLNNGDLGALRELVQPDLVEGLTTGLAGFLGELGNLRVTPVLQVAEDETVLTRIALSGIGKGEFLGFNVDGRELSTKAYMVAQVHCGLISSIKIHNIDIKLVKSLMA